MSGTFVVDVLIILALILYVLSHYRQGVFVLLRSLISFLGSVAISFLLYESVSAWATSKFNVLPGVADAVSFILLFLLIQTALNLILAMLFSFVPNEGRDSRLSHILGVFPALLDGTIVISLVLFLFVVAPFFGEIKKPIEGSRLGGTMVEQASHIEVYLDKIFGRAAQETLGFLTVKPEGEDAYTLPFRATKLSVDTESEEEMLVLLNNERVKRGLKPLVLDQSIVPVAREHSKDMWERSYFAHVNPDGKDPFDRMMDAGVDFKAAGENLALARTVTRAHEGLMNSPGHRRNILDPTFTRIGIGVIDGGFYGKMFTQNFAD